MGGDYSHSSLHVDKMEKQVSTLNVRFVQSAECLMCDWLYLPPFFKLEHDVSSMKTLIIIVAFTSRKVQTSKVYSAS